MSLPSGEIAGQKATRDSKVMRSALVATGPGVRLSNHHTAAAAAVTMIRPTSAATIPALRFAARGVAATGESFPESDSSFRS